MPQYITVTAAARTYLDDTTVAAAVDTLFGAESTGSGGAVRASDPVVSALTSVGGVIAQQISFLGTDTAAIGFLSADGLTAISFVDCTGNNPPAIGQYVTAYTQTPGDNSTRIATTAFATALVAGPTMEIVSGVAKARGPLTATTANGATTIALATSNRHVLTLTASATLSLTGDADGDSFVLWVRGQASGYTLTWWSGIKWTGGAAPTIPTTSGRVMAIAFTRLASGEYWGTAAPEAY